jgi:hypothetical protein
MAADVPARDATLGDCGFKGRGGGARSGSELSHLDLEVSRRQRAIVMSSSHSAQLQANLHRYQGSTLI